jgi:micrococcal nuclease
MPSTPRYKLPYISTLIITVITAILLLIFGAQGNKTGYDFGSYQATNYLVTSVTDGDTLKVSLNGKTEIIRLIGIDTPELDSTDPYTVCVAQAAKARMQTLAGQRYVSLMDDTTQSNRDRFQRLLRYIIDDKAVDIGKQLLLDGLAEEYTYKTDYTNKAEYIAAEKTAKLNKAGMWGTELCGAYK